MGGVTMSPSASLVWAALSGRTDDNGFAWYSVKDLCRWTGKSRRSVQYGLTELRKAGYVGFAEQVNPGVFRRPVKVSVDSFVEGGDV